MSRNRLILTIIIISIISGFIGYTLGMIITIKTVAEMASGFIDKELIEQAIFQYKNHIGNCFPSLL